MRIFRRFFRQSEIAAGLEGVAETEPRELHPDPSIVVIQSNEPRDKVLYVMIEEYGSPRMIQKHLRRRETVIRDLRGRGDGLSTAAVRGRREGCDAS